MPHSLRKRVAPSVQPVTPEQEAMTRRVLTQHALHLDGEPVHVLVVVEDRQPLPVLVRRDTFEPLEHLEALNGEAAFRGVSL